MINFNLRDQVESILERKNVSIICAGLKINGDVFSLPIKYKINQLFDLFDKLDDFEQLKDEISGCIWTTEDGWITFSCDDNVDVYFVDYHQKPQIPNYLKNV